MAFGPTLPVITAFAFMSATICAAEIPAPPEDADPALYIASYSNVFVSTMMKFVALPNFKSMMLSKCFPVADTAIFILDFLSYKRNN
jgi:hypothetical protein